MRRWRRWFVCLAYDPWVRLIGVSLSAGLVLFVSACGVSGASEPGIESPTPAATGTTQDANSAKGIKTILNGPRSINKVALTLDADYSPAAATRVETGEYPRQVNSAAIKYLTASDTSATFFVTGMWAQTYQSELTRLAANPRFELANHTFNHDAWTKSCYGLPYIGDSVAKLTSLKRTADIVREATGRSMPYARLPGLCHNRSDERLIADAGMRSVDTDVATSDAFATNPRAVANAMLSEVKPGSILLFHLNGAPNAPVTAEVLKLVVPGLKARGLTPVTLSELLAAR